jgi:hypothetical protein
MSGDLSMPELKERFNEGLRMAASRCRELSKATKDSSWMRIAEQLNALRNNGVKMIDQRSIGRQKTLDQFDMIGRKLATPQTAEELEKNTEKGLIKHG